jgi:hypothetical protein
VNVTFSGSVSAQAVTGETVTITVTKPDASTETVTAVTLADRSYTVTKAYVIAGAYSAKAHGDADAIYASWDSNSVPFTIALTARTGTLNVALS